MRTELSSTLTDASPFVDASLAGPVAAGTGTGRVSSCDQAATLASKSDPCRINPRQIESKILMLRKISGDPVTEISYGTMMVSPGCSLMFCAIFLP